jgi:CheY-like chemotaxis protein
MDPPGRLLLAEDDLLLAATLAEFLRDDGYMVTSTHNGAQALAAAEGLQFDVLLTDLRMPVMDGMALIRALRTQRPELAVVVMSGDEPPDWRRAIGPTDAGSGRLALIKKPMSLTQLREALLAVWPATARA